MQVASDRAKANGVPLILGDQPIEELGVRTKELLSETVRDLVSPLQGGWGRCVADVWRAATSAFPSAPSSASFTALGVQDILDPPLVAAAPVSLLRYPTAWLIRSPVSVLTLAFTVVVLTSLPDLLMATVGAASAGEQQFVIESGMGIAERVDVLAHVDPKVVLTAAAGTGGELLIAFAEIVLFARVFLVGSPPSPSLPPPHPLLSHREEAQVSLPSFLLPLPLSLPPSPLPPFLPLARGVLKRGKA